MSTEWKSPNCGRNGKQWGPRLVPCLVITSRVCVSLGPAPGPWPYKRLARVSSYKPLTKVLRCLGQGHLHWVKWRTVLRIIPSAWSLFPHSTTLQTLEHGRFCAAMMLCGWLKNDPVLRRLLLRLNTMILNSRLIKSLSPQEQTSLRYSLAPPC